MFYLIESFYYRKSTKELLEEAKRGSSMSSFFLVKNPNDRQQIIVHQETNSTRVSAVAVQGEPNTSALLDCLN